MSGPPHPIARAKERYGLKISLKVLQEIEQAIEAGNSVVMRKDNHHGIPTEIHALTIEGKAVRLVYEPGRCRVLTFLPENRRSSRDKRRRAMLRKRRKSK